MRAPVFGFGCAALVGLVLSSTAFVACGTERNNFGEDDAAAPTSGTFTPDGDGGPTEPSLPDDATACTSETIAADAVPLAMLLLMDRSGSMLDPAGASKWDAARSAMVAFTDNQATAGTMAGLSVFPSDNTSATCSPLAYGPVVDLGVLPDNGTNIKTALYARKPEGSTPMYSALSGALSYMRSYLTKNAGGEGVVVLVTDGDPVSECMNDYVQNVVNLAYEGAHGTPPVRTFAVGMDGATFLNLDQIAAAGGGAPTAFNASGKDGGAPRQELLDSLLKIRAGALGCEYAMPVPDRSKGVLDPTSVAINYTPGTNDPIQTIMRVANLDACGETTGGFYYDDPSDPKRIVLCPASCDAVRKGGSGAKVDVFLGCITKVN